MRVAGTWVWAVLAGAALAGCPPIPGLGEKQPTPAEVDAGPLGGGDAGSADAGAVDGGAGDASAADGGGTDAG